MSAKEEEFLPSRGVKSWWNIITAATLKSLTEPRRNHQQKKATHDQEFVVSIEEKKAGSPRDLHTMAKHIYIYNTRSLAVSSIQYSTGSRID